MLDQSGVEDMADKVLDMADPQEWQELNPEL